MFFGRNYGEAAAVDFSARRGACCRRSAATKTISYGARADTTAA